MFAFGMPGEEQTYCVMMSVTVCIMMCKFTSYIMQPAIVLSLNIHFIATVPWRQQCLSLSALAFILSMSGEHIATRVKLDEKLYPSPLPLQCLQKNYAGAWVKSGLELN